MYYIHTETRWHWVEGTCPWRPKNFHVVLFEGAVHTTGASVVRKILSIAPWHITNHAVTGDILLRQTDTDENKVNWRTSPDYFRLRKKPCEPCLLFITCTLWCSRYCNQSMCLSTLTITQKPADGCQPNLTGIGKLWPSRTRPVCTFPAVPRSTQPSTLRGMVNEYQLSGWVITINGDGGCRR